MKNGCVLNGGVGSGKSLTALSYYFLQEGGKFNRDGLSKMKNPRDLYIITTARKRDDLEWEGELSHFLLTTNPDISIYKHKVVIDSWNNIGKYTDVKGAFFIFDEQRVVGYGAWSKAFLQIVKANDWILLSATPGDCWMDYIPVFIANGFYKNKRQFELEHVVYSPYSKFRKVDRYLSTGKLIRLRNEILVDMDFQRKTVRHNEDVFVNYDTSLYKDVMKTRWNPYLKKPIKNANQLCYILRRVVNTDDSRMVALLEILEKNPKVIVFYNFDYELELLKTTLSCYDDVELAEWNGHTHQPIPDSDKWVYLVQYTAGAEGWNCVKTDTIIFFSQNYSYKIVEQASGRIDRLNTPFRDLYYYHLRSRSGIDLAITRALNTKKKFNAKKFTKWDEVSPK
jgi:hypothetical protein